MTSSIIRQFKNRQQQETKAEKGEEKAKRVQRERQGGAEGTRRGQRDKAAATMRTIHSQSLRIRALRCRAGEMMTRPEVRGR
jgi:hypothetical protein